MSTPALLGRRSLMAGVIAAPFAGAAANPVVAAPNGSEASYPSLVIDPGPLKLANEAKLQWRKPDGSGYVEVMRMEKRGAVRLCDDEFFYNSDDKQHLYDHVIEVRNPHSDYPDFRLPITRTKTLNADSKLQVRSMTVLETCDPPEINFFRTGTDGGSEHGPVRDGANVGLIRWYGRKATAKDGRDDAGMTKSVEMQGRSFGNSVADHYGTFHINILDYRFPKGPKGSLMLTKLGLRVGHLQDSPRDNKVAGMFEVDNIDNRPIVFRRPDAKVGDTIAIAFATGKGGEAVAAENQMFEVRASVTSAKPLKTSIDFRVSTAQGMKTAFTILDNGQVKFSQPILQG